MRYAVALVLLIACVGGAAAGELTKGDKEAAFRFAYSNTDLGTSDGSDFGSVENIDLSITYGWLLTDRHQLGLLAGYLKEETDGGNLFEDSSVDATRLGGFYAFNIKTKGILTPYIGASIASIGGDLSDAYNLQYGAEIGLKIYPFEHAGLSIGLGYAQLASDAEGLPDASGISLGAGLLIKY
jgi:hypothetical protein